VTLDLFDDVHVLTLRLFVVMSTFICYVNVHGFSQIDISLFVCIDDGD
jgi:hypothetical protein